MAISGGVIETYSLNYNSGQYFDGAFRPSVTVTTSSPGASTYAPPTTFTSPPAPIQGANLAFNAQTWGTTIPLVMGSVRLTGAMIWAKGFDVASVPTAGGGPITSLTFAVAFGYALDPNEQATVNRVWANGNLVWNAGAAIVPGVEFTYYPGSETQLPDPLILADKGAAVTPGFRGLRYLMFPSFPLKASSFATPQISVEFIIGNRINVADVFTLIGKRAGINVSVVGIDDQCDGFIGMQDIIPAQFFRAKSLIYNFQIEDKGDPIILRRRAVNASLSIDVTLNDIDLLVSKPDDDAFKIPIVEPTEIPAQVLVRYLDQTLDYQMSEQSAERTTLGHISRAQQIFDDTDFVHTGVETRGYAFDIMYRASVEKQAVTLNTTDFRIEPADVVQLDTAFADFVFKTMETQLLPDHLSNQVQGAMLLQKTGALFGADSGNILVSTTLPYPDVIDGAIAVIASGQLWCSTSFAGAPFGVVGATVPDIPPSVVSSSIGKTPDGNNLLQINPQDATSDGTYLYWFDSSGDFCRQSIADPSAIDTISTNPFYPGGFFGKLSERCICAGFLYSIGGFTGHPVVVYKIDLSLFAVVAYLDIPSSMVLGESYIVVGTNLIVSGRTQSYTHSPSSSVLARVDLTSFTVAETLSIGTNFLGAATTDGTNAYFMPVMPVSIGAAAIFYVGAKVPGASLAAIQYFDTRGDPNVLIPGGSPLMDLGAFHGSVVFNDGIYLYFVANNFDQAPIIINAPYLARRRLSDLSVASGLDLRLLFPYQQFVLGAAVTDGQFIYITGNNAATSTPASGCILKISQNLASSFFYAYGGLDVAPVNDNFVNASPIAPGQTFAMRNVYATAEVGEPPHDPADTSSPQRSLWWYVTAPATGRMFLNTKRSAIKTDASVYIGGALNALTRVSSTFSGDGFVHWQAVAGQRYFFGIDGYNGAAGTVRISLQNFQDDFATISTVNLYSGGTPFTGAFGGVHLSGYVYVPSPNERVISRINESSLAVSYLTVGSSGDKFGGPPITDGTYVYVAYLPTAGTTVEMLRIHTDFATVDTLTVRTPASGQCVYQMAIVAGHLWMVAATVPGGAVTPDGTIYRVLLSDFATIDSFNLTTLTNPESGFGGICTDGTYAYLAPGAGKNAIRIDPASFNASGVTTVNVDAFEPGLNGGAFPAADTGTLYIPSGVGGKFLIMVALADFATVTTLDVTFGEGELGEFSWWRGAAWDGASKIYLYPNDRGSYGFLEQYDTQSGALSVIDTVTQLGITDFRDQGTVAIAFDAASNYRGYLVAVGDGSADVLVGIFRAATAPGSAIGRFAGSAAFSAQGGYWGSLGYFNASASFTGVMGVTGVFLGKATFTGIS